MQARHWLFKIVLAALCASGSVAAQADEWTYTVRPGDDLWSIARQYCGSATLAESIAEHNQLKNPASIRAGNRIRIPTDWLVFAPAAAEVVNVTGTAVIDKAAQTPTQSERATSRVVVGMQVDMGDTLITEAGSVVVRFADGSTLNVQQNSRVLFNKLTAFGPAGMVDTHLRFAYGRGVSRVKPQNRGDRFRIETPEGVAAVRGTEFRVGYDRRRQTTNTETLEGRVAFLHLEQTTDLPAGYGVAATRSGLTRETLLPAPRFIDKPEVIDRDAVVAWSEVPGAIHYVVSWAAQSAPHLNIAQTRTEASNTRLQMAPGQYLLQVRAVSEAQIEGLDATAPVVVRADAPTPDARTQYEAPEVTLRWRDTNSADSFQGLVTNLATQARTPFTTTARSQTLPLAPGRYTWQVQSDRSGWSEPVDITVLPATPDNLRVERKQKTLTVTWSGSDPAARYLVTATPQSGGTPVTLETGEPQAVLSVPEFDRYRVSVVALSKQMQSRPAEQPVNVARRPWWLLGLAALVFAL